MNKLLVMPLSILLLISVSISAKANTLDLTGTYRANAVCEGVGASGAFTEKVTNSILYIQHDVNNGSVQLFSKAFGGTRHKGFVPNGTNANGQRELGLGICPIETVNKGWIETIRFVIDENASGQLTLEGIGAVSGIDLTFPPFNEAFTETCFNSFVRKSTDISRKGLQRLSLPCELDD